MIKMKRRNNIIIPSFNGAAGSVSKIGKQQIIFLLIALLFINICTIKWTRSTEATTKCLFVSAQQQQQQQILIIPSTTTSTTTGTTTSTTNNQLADKIKEQRHKQQNVSAGTTGSATTNTATAVTDTMIKTETLSLSSRTSESSSALKVNCNNSNFVRVRIKFLFFLKRSTSCLYIKRNKRLCDDMNYNTNQPIGITCAKECTTISGCRQPQLSVPTTTLLPPPSTPTSAPIITTPPPTISLLSSSLSFSPTTSSPTLTPTLTLASVNTPVTKPVVTVPVPTPVILPIFSAPRPVSIVAPAVSIPIAVSLPTRTVVIVPVPTPTLSVVAPQPRPIRVTPTIPVSSPQLSPIIIATPIVPVSLANLIYPPGPYIQVETSSKVVTIPRPPKPLALTLNIAATNCPHSQVGLKIWRLPNTWPNSIIPLSNADVILPENTKILIDRTINRMYGIITIPKTSELIIGSDSILPIHINIKGMNVYGKLTIGSESCRIVTPVSIILHGTRPLNVTRNIPLPSIKGINVDGGILNLHGKRYYPTWTRLSKTITPGTNIIFLQESVNWEVGQQIILITSSLKDSRDYNQNEILTIQEIDTNPLSIDVGTIIIVKETIQHTHVANEYYQIEVGSLSRTITIQGNSIDSKPTDPDPLNRSCMDVDATKDKKSIYFNTTRPCIANTELTGYGGHIIIQNNGSGYVEGIELLRMGQTNVKGRYPIHFHLLGNNCSSCYFTDSSIHNSYYRCISIHGTHNVLVNENVAYDIVGYCYYMESGIEENNTLSYNLAAHIHPLGPYMMRGAGHDAPIIVQNDETLILPADVSASGFYITNMYNTIIGNAASGGWSGFAFPILNTPLDFFRNEPIRPSSTMALKIDGNTGHSSGWWWKHASPFYFGATLSYNKDDKLKYNPGRSDKFFRNTCKVNPCVTLKNDCGRCDPNNDAWMRVTNSKSFLTAGVGFNSWNGRMELLGYEAHDVRLAFQAISTTGLWLDNMLAVCRTGENLDLPSRNPQNLAADGITWYDINQKHIVTDSTFRNCGARSDQYDQYDTSPTRGCDSNPLSGCDTSSTTFGFLTSSDIFAPQIMTATRNITFDDCGRRFSFENPPIDTVSGRGQNWIDVDGTISGFNERTLIGSGVNSVKDWWGVDNKVFYDEQAPITFIRQDDGPQRAMAYTRILWDDSLHIEVGKTLCKESIPCPTEGFVRHAGKKFSPIANPGVVTHGMPLTAKANVNGLSGGFAWIVNFNKTAPRRIEFEDMEIAPDSVLLISIQYPIGTTFNVTATNSVCWPSTKIRCTEIFTQVSSTTEVRNGPGNTYFVDTNGVFTFRLAQMPYQNVGAVQWNLPNYTTPAFFERDLWSLQRFERDGVLLPVRHTGASYYIQARCPLDTSTSSLTGYCKESVPIYDPDVCITGFVQVAYDACCNIVDMKKCMYADGSKNF